MYLFHFDTFNTNGNHNDSLNVSVTDWSYQMYIVNYSQCYRFQFKKLGAICFGLDEHACLMSLSLSKIGFLLKSCFSIHFKVF